MKLAVLDAADAMVGQGAIVEAVEMLVDANRREPGDLIEARLVELRHLAFRGQASASSPSAAAADSVLAAPDVGDPFPGVNGQPPAIDAKQLDARILSGALRHHGCLFVHGLFDATTCSQLVDDIDHVFATIDVWPARPADGQRWFAPFNPEGSDLGINDRLWPLNGGTVWAADSPRTFFDLLEAFDRAGLGPMLTELFGERPVLSLQKCAVRRVQPGAQGAWHQDGTFLGDGSRVITVNSWIALSDCGRDAPGLDLVPMRFDETVPSGTDGAPFDWCVGQGMVDRLAGSAGIVRPHFTAGDALLFDDLLLHQTGGGPHHTEPRYSIESWFIAPSTYPDKWVPFWY